MAFIHVPRTAGLSIGQTLLDNWDDADTHWRAGGGLGMAWTLHATATVASADVPGWDQMHSFGFVRNPWDRMVSIWRKFGPNRDFETFIESPTFLGLNLRPQTEWLFDHKGEQLVSEIGRFETLDCDFARIAQRWGNAKMLPHINGSEHVQWRSYYTSSLRDRVAAIFAADIAAFDYQF